VFIVDPHVLCDKQEAEASTSKLWSEQVDEGASDVAPDDIRTVTVQDNIYKAAKSFEDLKLPSSLLQGLYTEMQFQRPSKIQGQTLPMILEPPFHSLIAQVSVLDCMSCGCAVCDMIITAIAKCWQAHQ